MAQKVAADKAGAASATQAGAAVAATQTKISQAGDVLTRLSRNYVEGFGSAERFTRAVNTLGRGIETGNVPMERAEAILDGIYRKFNLTADAAQLASAGHDKLSQAVQRLNARYQATAQLADRAADAQRRSAAAGDFQTGINSSLGVRDNFDTARRGADVAAYGAELDRLRAKYNPLFSVIRQYRSEISDVREANRLGAISQDEMTAAINRQRTAALQAIDALKGRAGVPVAGKGSNAGSFQAANIAAQFQDIAVTGAMPGSNPIQIALQQGTQLSAVLQQIKTEGQSTGAALASALGSVISPLSLITIGVIAVGVASAQWLVSMIPKVKTADEALKTHADLVGRIKTAYGDALDGVERYTRESPALLSALSRKSTAELEVAMRAEQEKINQFNSVLFADVDGIFRENFKPKQQFAPFTTAIDTLRQQMAAGKPDFDAFYASINQTVDADQSLRKVGDELITSTENGGGLALALEQAAAQAKVLENAVEAAYSALSSMPKTIGAGEAQFVVDSLAEGQKSAQAHQIELDAINAKSPAQLADIARRRVALELDGQAITEALKKQKIDEASALAYAQASQGFVDADRNRLRALNDNVAAQRLELDVVGKSVEETERLKFARQNLAAAEAEAAQNGTSVSAAYRAEVERLAAAYGKLQQQIALRTLSDDLKFDRAQLFRTPAEQTVSSTLRPIFGNDLTSSQALFAANQIRVNEQLKEMNDIGHDITGGFLSTLKTDLMNGATAFEALGNAGAGALDKLANKALDMAADGLWSMLFGSLSSTLFGGGFGGNPANLGTGIGFGIPIAKGGVFAGSGIGQYTSSIVDRPTLFPFAKGVGLMGEAGPEAIMPLRRGPDGRLGVAANSNASNDNGGWTGDMHITINANSEDEGAAAARGFAREMKQWRKSGDGHAFVRKVVGRPGRAN